MKGLRSRVYCEDMNMNRLMENGMEDADRMTGAYVSC